ncbi:uncharacterized protein CANTADRAFT_90090 [Suhomyces tanzawaensis NRRL Y-17324]|uniref:Sas10 C-terminal domain-containing protein n=1 Tax=Suhomyces tanzawaensis NRRL Y-17324 TaxID=984487 RepID=A0A1E4SHL7_9ASCO|nr:uncharacterized protein CANTADRAFT_90090 [Suhomyces tanzawaensis NRRL Y-17324]ODV78977.1 hypothetical protein CANTADRAFT_90090 [Suhomyces tanzawaensis NRRL Y-17324]
MAMARRTRNKHHVGEDVELDEVDAFNANQEKILLDNAGDYAQADDYDESSEEEVMGINVGEDNEDDVEDDDEDEDSLGEDEEEAEDEEVAGWGGKKAYYGGDDASDDEDAKQMSEEALRQQKKHLEELALDDYVDEDVMEDWKKGAVEEQEKQEAKSQFIISKDSTINSLSDGEKMELLTQSFPEFVPLLSELTLLKPRLEELQAKPSNELVEVKKVALAAYLGSIASYFAMFVDNLNGEAFSSMKENPVMESILRSREVWRQANELPDSELAKHTAGPELESGSDVEMGALEVDSDMESDSDSGSGSGSESDSKYVDARESESDIDIDITAKRSIKTAARARTGDFSEATPDDVDMEDKQRRKKTLRFYTSKIDQAQAKNNERYSGDLDLPYRERLFERQQRLVEEARKKGLGQDKLQLGDDLDGQDYGSEDERVAEDVNNGDDLEYYQSLKQSGTDKKMARKQAHEEAVKAAKEGKLEELQEHLGADGKRAINYQILKNKGLTPHRKKEYRNSRVKKRKQYEKAQKKLGSVRQVYKGDSGPYQGEKTGIKKGLSRSVKLV